MDPHHNLLCELLQVVGIAPPDLVIFEDNQSCIKMTKNPVNHGRAKHIDIKYHHNRDEVKRGLVQVDHRRYVGRPDDEGTRRSPPRRLDQATWSRRMCTLRGRVDD